MNFTIEGVVSKPYLQAVIIISVSLLVLLIWRPKEADTVYTISGVIYAVFIFVNCVSIFFVPRVWSYFFYSMLFSVLYIIVMAMLIELFNRIRATDGSGESGMIFLVIIYHPLAALLAIFFKWLYRLIFN